jgi:hypothetical protein
MLVTPADLIVKVNSEVLMYEVEAANGSQAKLELVLHLAGHDSMTTAKIALVDKDGNGLPPAETK